MGLASLMLAKLGVRRVVRPDAKTPRCLAFRPPAHSHRRHRPTVHCPSCCPTCPPSYLQVCTDGEPSLPPLCRDHAERNGLGADQFRALEFRWGDAAQLEAVLQAVDDAGRCSELILASEVLYSVDEDDFAPLEGAIRALISRGGCRLVAMCWQVRNYNEERFLPRLADLGRARVAWRSHGLSPDDACPRDGAVGCDAWRAQHSMTWAVGVLEVHPLSHH